MSQSATAAIPFALPTTSIHASFNGPQLTSDGGLLWLSEADTALGLCAALARHIPEWRHSSVRHSLETLVRQRVFQIACGYEDQDDADTLRTDPLLKLVCGRLPDEADLASEHYSCECVRRLSLHFRFRYREPKNRCCRSTVWTALSLVRIVIGRT